MDQFTTEKRHIAGHKKAGVVRHGLQTGKNAAKRAKPLDQILNHGKFKIGVIFRGVRDND